MTDASNHTATPDRSTKRRRVSSSTSSTSPTTSVALATPFAPPADTDPETLTWLRSSTIQKRLHNALSLRAMLIDRDKLKKTILSLKLHVTNGTVPRSMIIKDTLTLGSDATDEINNKVIQTRKTFEQSNLQLVIDTRSITLNNLELKISSLLVTERTTIVALLSPTPSDQADPILSNFLTSSISDDATRSMRVEKYMEVFKAQCSAIAADYSLSLKATQAEEQKDKDVEMAVDKELDTIVNNPSPAIKALIEKEVTKRMDTLTKQLQKKQREIPSSSIKSESRPTNTGRSSTRPSTRQSSRAPSPAEHSPPTRSSTQNNNLAKSKPLGNSLPAGSTNSRRQGFPSRPSVTPRNSPRNSPSHSEYDDDNNNNVRHQSSPSSGRQSKNLPPPHPSRPPNNRSNQQRQQEDDRDQDNRQQSTSSHRMNKPSYASAVGRSFNSRRE